MPEQAPWSPDPAGRPRVGVVSTFPPTRCGIARFTSSLHRSLTAADPGMHVDVVRLVCDPSPNTSGPPVTMELDPGSSVGIRAAARHLDRGDLAIINHEFGIYGPHDGESVLELAGLLEIPVLTIFHTVLPEPSDTQRRIIQDLAERATPVVLCSSARDMLIERYSIPAGSIQLIPHGAHWSAQPVSGPPRRELITWGLLGPGKGLERALLALSRLGDLDPPVRYRIVGRTHPNVVRNAGHVYRHSLETLVGELGLTDQVEFIDRYVDEEELFELVRASDLVVVPYDNRDQVSSGVITEAIGMGRPVVATRFPYAEGMLGSGAGIVVDHDPNEMANAIRRLLEDPIAYRRAAREAGLKSSELSWTTIGRQYSNLIRDLTPARATA